MDAQKNTVEKAVFAAGCFWGVEARLQKISGVVGTRVGYTGGTTPHATYEQVCGGGTGHAEAVEITFEPATVSFAALLSEFWRLHDPTQLNRQGPDVGSQYRSAIFYIGDAQRTAAEDSKKQAQENFSRPIATEISPASDFWPAEDYHQCYVQKRGRGIFGR